MNYTAFRVRENNLELFKKILDHNSHAYFAK